MNNPELFDESNRATYCPEDNKLRLYVGRVPRPEYDALRAEGWIALPKQREAGQGDFAATWTPSRRNTAISYAGIIEDEDAGPDERAADRAERFGGYLDKRIGDAEGHADRFDGQPLAHGFQNAAKAERATERHDKIGSRAVDAWGKAEYWQQRTAGVIGHALYVSSPSVRMGRIKTLESELRALEAGYTPNPKAGKINQRNDDGIEVPFVWVGHSRGGHWAEESKLAAYQRGAADWMQHLTLRIAYENQMLEAQGGRAAHVEMEIGGWLGSRQIHKVNKSVKTGRVVSVQVQGPRVQGWTYKAENVPGTDYALYQIETERLGPDAYRAPTPDELEAFHAARKAEKDAKPKKPTIPLINPSDKDAQRLCDLWNEIRRAAHEKGNIYSAAEARAAHSKEFKPCTIVRMTQAQYSGNSQGEYARYETRGIYAGALLHGRNSWFPRSATEGLPMLCQVRMTGFDPVYVVILTDKPQKDLTATIWPAPSFALEMETVGK